MRSPCAPPYDACAWLCRTRGWIAPGFRPLPTPRSHTAYRRARGLSLILPPRRAKPYRSLKTLSRFSLPRLYQRARLSPTAFSRTTIRPAKPRHFPRNLPVPQTKTPPFDHPAKFFKNPLCIPPPFVYKPGTPTGTARALGNRLTVDPRTLTPLVLVRIQVPQPIFPWKFNSLASCRQCWEHPHAAPPQGAFGDVKLSAARSRFFLLQATSSCTSPGSSWPARNIPVLKHNGAKDSQGASGAPFHWHRSAVPDA